MTRSHRTLTVLFTLATLLSACRIKGKEQHHQPIGDDASTLRAAFNADVGKVRVLMLVAPT